MSDGKEVKRFQLGELLSKGEHSLLSEWISAPDHDRIVAELKTYASELELKIADLVLFPDQESSLKTIAELRAEVETKRNEQIKVISDLSEQLTEARVMVERTIRRNVKLNEELAFRDAMILDSKKTIATQARVIEKLKANVAHDEECASFDDYKCDCWRSSFFEKVNAELEGAKHEQTTEQSS